MSQEIAVSQSGTNGALSQSGTLSERAQSGTFSSLTNEFLTQLKDSIEKMQKVNQVEVLRILKKQNAKLNENKSGVLVNLTFLQKDVLNELCNYVKYVQEQEKMINMDETQKNEFKNTYFH
jgi:hypothetical protein